MTTPDREPAVQVLSTVSETLPVAAVGVLLLRRMRLLLAVAVAFAVVTVLVLILQGRRYTADTSFLPQGRAARSEISGLAAQLGISVPTATASESPLFFVDLARARPVLSSVADSATAVLQGTSLEDLFDIAPGAAQRRRAKAISAFNRALGAAVSTKTGIVELTLTTPNASASAELLALLVRTIDRINGASHRTHAGAQRRFTEERVNATRQELRHAEDRLQYFLERNRVAGSSKLTIEEERLRRDIQSAQSLYSALLEATEQARLEELRDTPAITVLEAPVAPLDPDPRHLGRYAFVAAAFGGLIAMLYVFLTNVEMVRGLSAEEARAELGRTIRLSWLRNRGA